MALGDLNRRVLTTYAADTTQLEAGHARAKASSDDMSHGIIEGAKEANEGINSLVEKIVGIGVAFEGVKKIAEFAWDGYKDGIKDAINANAAMGVDLERLKEAAHGLVTENDLLAFSAKAMNGAFKNSQGDLENAQKAMLALERKGYDAAQAQQAITDALVSGRVRGLEPMGVIIDKHIKDLDGMAEANMSLAQKEELHARALQSIATLADQVSDSSEGVGESMGKSVTQLKDAWDDLKKSVGQLVVAMQPLIGVLASTVKLITDIINSVSDNEEPSDWQVAGLRAAGTIPQAGQQFGNYMARGTGIYDASAIDRARSMGVAAVAADNAPKEFEITPDEVEKWEQHKKEQERQWAEQQKAQDAYNKRMYELADQEAKRASEYRNSAQGKASQYGASLARSGQLGVADDNATGVGSFEFAQLGGKLNDIKAGETADMTKSWRDQTEAYDKKKTSFLEKSFGKVGDFDLYKTAFDSLSGAVGASMKAWIDGSESAGDAFKKFVSTALSSLASQMLIESLKHAAYALGSLAFGDVSGAAAHAIAAAEFGAGAAAAAIAAKELGGSSTSTSTSSSSSGSSSTSSSSSGSSSTSSSSSSGSQGGIIAYSDSFSEDSSRMRRVRAQKLWNRVTGTSYARNQ